MQLAGIAMGQAEGEQTKSAPRGLRGGRRRFGRLDRFGDDVAQTQTGDLLHHGALGPLPDAEHGDDRGHAEEHPEQGEQRPQFVTQ